MGTSKGYDAPRTPQWGEIKGKVTRLARDGRPSSDTARDIMGRFIRTNGGIRHGAGSGGIGVGKSAQVVARNIANFVSLVGTSGFDEALRQTGLDYLRGKSTSEIVISLIDYLGEDASTIDQVDARNALSRLMSELLDEAKDIREVEEVLETCAQGEELCMIVEKFFGYYLYEQFCRVFYERLEARVGNVQAEFFLDGILDFIKSEVTVFSLDRDITRIDWSGQEGEDICTQILEKTLEIYGG